MHLPQYPGLIELGWAELGRGQLGWAEPAVPYRNAPTLRTMRVHRARVSILPKVVFRANPEAEQLLREYWILTSMSKAIRRHADARKWLASWVATVEDAIWESLDEVRADYPSPDGVNLKSQIVITVFNVNGNEYRLLTNINFTGQTALVLELLTHAGYDKDQWKGRY